MSEFYAMEDILKAKARINMIKFEFLAWTER